MNRTQIALVVPIVIAVVGCTQDRQPAGQVQSAPAVERIAEPNVADEASQAHLLEEKWGIRVERAVLSAGGYMLDFRFRVLDAAKAAPILDRRIKPHLVDQATGAVFAVPSPPKLGQLRSGGNIREGTVYFIMFANPAKYLKTGNKVTVVVGDFRARDVVIQ